MRYQKRTCFDRIVDETLRDFVSVYSQLRGTSDMEIKLHLFIVNWNNNHNKTRKLTLEQVKIFLVTIHTNVRLNFIKLAKNFNIPACAAAQLLAIVNEVLNTDENYIEEQNSSITCISSDENWPPSLCEGINQEDMSDDDDIFDDEYDIYDEAGDNAQYIHNEHVTDDFASKGIVNIIPRAQNGKWDVHFSNAGGLYYHRCLLSLKLDIIIITHIFKQAFKLYVLCMYYSLYFGK